MHYNTLDQLAIDFPTGIMIKFLAGEQVRTAQVVGVTWSLPFQTGGRKEPALVTDDPLYGGIGNVYPHEVIDSGPS